MARKLEVEIVGDASSLHRALNQSSGGLRKWASAGAVAGAAASVTTKAMDLLGEGLISSIHAALEAQKSQARLQVAFRNAGLAVKPYQERIEELEASNRKLGFSDDETRNSLGSLIIVTKNYQQAVKEQAIAMDLARFKGVDLEQATKALTMAHAGSLRALKQLGLAVPKVTTAQDALKAATKDHTSEAYKNALATAKQRDTAATMANVLDTVTKATHGQAQAFSDTAAGAMAQFHVQLQHIEEEIGLKLLPVMTQAIIWVRDHWPEITKVLNQFWASAKPILVNFQDLIKTTVATIKSHWSTIGPIVMAIAALMKTQLALVAGAIRIVTSLLKGDWGQAWEAAKGIASAYANAIKAVAVAAFTVVSAAIHSVINALEDLFSLFKRKIVVPELNAVIGAFKALYGVIQSVINAVETLIGALGRIHVPSIHIPHVHVPGLAAGGTVASPGFAMVGEKGPELLNLPGGASVTPLGSGGSSGGRPMIINLVLDGKVAAQALIDPLRGEATVYKQRTGRPAFG